MGASTVTTRQTRASGDSPGSRRPFPDRPTSAHLAVDGRRVPARPAPRRRSRWSGILVQTQFRETGAWFGQFAFGGTGERIMPWPSTMRPTAPGRIQQHDGTRPGNGSLTPPCSASPPPSSRTASKPRPSKPSYPTRLSSASSPEHPRNQFHARRHPATRRPMAVCPGESVGHPRRGRPPQRLGPRRPLDLHRRRRMA